jgi:hypothetical protein
MSKSRRNVAPGQLDEAHGPCTSQVLGQVSSVKDNGVHGHTIALVSYLGISPAEKKETIVFANSRRLVGMAVALLSVDVLTLRSQESSNPTVPTKSSYQFSVADAQAAEIQTAPATLRD